MDVPTVPHDDERSLEFLSQPTQEVDRVVGPDILALHIEVGADASMRRRKCDGADHAQSIASVPRTLLLRTESQLVEESRHVPRMRLDAEASPDGLGHPLASPQVGLKTCGERSGHDQVDQFVTLSDGELADAPGCGLAESPATPPSRQARFQRLELLKFTTNRSATVRRDSPAWKHSAARRRRASSSVALP